MSKKKVEEMSVAEVLATKEFEDEISKLINDLSKDRDDAKQKYGKRLKAHPIDKLRKQGVFNALNLTSLYGQVLDKRVVGYSAAERKFILECGTEAFGNVMNKLVKKSKKAKEILKQRCDKENSK